MIDIKEWISANITAGAEPDLLSASRVCIFGLSANPPTVAHVEIVQLLQSLKDECGINVFDAVLVLPVYNHVYSSKLDVLSSTATYEQRMEMSRIAFSETFDNDPQSRCSVHVLPLEHQAYQCVMALDSADSKCPTIRDDCSPRTSQRKGTSFLLDFITALYPTFTNISLCLGEDTANDLLAGKWFNSEIILNKVQLFVVRRSQKNVSDSIVDSEYKEKDRKGTKNTMNSSPSSEHTSMGLLRNFPAARMSMHNISSEYGKVSSTEVRSLIGMVFHSSILQGHEYLEKNNNDKDNNNTAATEDESGTLQESIDELNTILPAGVYTYIQNTGLYLNTAKSTDIKACVNEVYSI